MGYQRGGARIPCADRNDTEEHSPTQSYDRAHAVHRIHERSERIGVATGKGVHLPSIDRMDSPEDYRFTYIGYDGPSRTSAEKEESFIRSLNKLEAGKRYLFLDHPALDNEEMRTVFHIGYEQVALDRQGVTDLLTSPRVKQVIEDKGIKPLPPPLGQNAFKKPFCVEASSSRPIAAYIHIPFFARSDALIVAFLNRVFNKSRSRICNQAFDRAGTDA